MEPVLELTEIHKSFGNVKALAGVSLSLFPGEVLALLGDNGAGKSTLIKMLSGVHHPDKGVIRIRGTRVDPKTYNARKAREMGIETVYQERSLGEKQPIWRNVFMGRHLTNRFGFIDIGTEKRITEQLLKRHLGLTGAGLTADAPVKNLSGGERQGLAIGRAIHFDSDTVVLDEPTTALSLKEVGRVLDFIRTIPDNGKSCILITHNLIHAFGVADRFLILEKGRIAGAYRKTELTLDTLQQKLLAAAGGGRHDAFRSREKGCRRP